MYLNALCILQLKARNVIKEVNSSLQDIQTNIDTLQSLFGALYPPVDEDEDIPVPVSEKGNSGSNSNSGSTGGIPSYLINAVYESDTDSDARSVRESESDGPGESGESSDEEYDDIMWESGPPVSTDNDINNTNTNSSVNITDNIASSEYGNYLESINNYVIPSSSNNSSVETQFESESGSRKNWLGNRYYSLNLTLPVTGAINHNSSSSASDNIPENNQNNENIEEMNGLVDELSNHLTIYALPKLEYWKRILELGCKYSKDNVINLVVDSQKMEDVLRSVSCVFEDLLFLLQRKNAIMPQNK